MTVSLDAFDDEYEDELTPAQLVALDAMDGGFDPADLDPDEFEAGPPEEWLALSPRERLARPPAPGPVVPEVLDAGFTHRDGGDGRGFAAGGALDQMAPGGVLAMAPTACWANGLDRLSDDELIGLMAAARRLRLGRPRWSWPRSMSCPPAGRVPMAVRVSMWRKRSRRR